jgi:hypothetical protein
MRGRFTQNGEAGNRAARAKLEAVATALRRRSGARQESRALFIVAARQFERWEISRANTPTQRRGYSALRARTKSTRRAGAAGGISRAWKKHCTLSKRRPAIRPSASIAKRPRRRNPRPVMPVLAALSFAHLLNDTMQSLIPAIYPILKDALQLDFRHIGLITLVNQLTASILQPFVGFYTDRRPKPYSLAIGMSFTLVGLVLLSLAGSFALVLVAVGFVGIGSSVFHPKRRGSRISRPAVGTASRNRSSRSAAMPAARSARCSQR